MVPKNEFQTSFPKLLNQREVAKIIRKSTAWLERKRWSGGGIPYHKVGRHVLYDESDVIAWLEKQPYMTSTSTPPVESREAK